MRVVLALTAVAAVIGVAAASADDLKYSCSRGDTVRTVSVVTDTSSGHVCEVQYEKTSLGETPEVLWHADTDTSFCNDQAKALVGRLGDAGWTCNPIASQSASQDDTPEPFSAAVEVDTPTPKTDERAGDPPASGVTGATAAVAKPAATNDDVAPVPVTAPAAGAPGFNLRPTIH
jgi:hypothetical protein